MWTGSRQEHDGDFCPCQSGGSFFFSKNREVGQPLPDWLICVCSSHFSFSYSPSHSSSTARCQGLARLRDCALDLSHETAVGAHFERDQMLLQFAICPHSLFSHGVCCDVGLFSAFVVSGSSCYFTSASLAVFPSSI